MYNYCYLFNYIWHYLSAWDSFSNKCSLVCLYFLHIVCSDERQNSFSVKMLAKFFLWRKSCRSMYIQRIGFCMGIKCCLRILWLILEVRWIVDCSMWRSSVVNNFYVSFFFCTCWKLNFYDAILQSKTWN